MKYFNCLINSFYKFIGYNVFEPKIFFDYEKTISIGIYNDNIYILTNNPNNNTLYKLTNILKVNDNNFKLFFSNKFSNVIFISISKKTTYLWIEIIDVFCNYQKALIVDSIYSKRLNKFFDNYKNLINLDYLIITDFINFLHFQDIYW